MKRIISLLIGIIALTAMAQAIEEYDVNIPINLPFTCTINGAIPSASATFNVTITDPYGAVVVENKEATPRGNGGFNYTHIFSKTGTYTIKEDCIDGTESYSIPERVNIIGVGNTSGKGITQTDVFLIIAIVISLFMYLKVSGLFGSIMIMIIGFGMLFTTKESGWIGWIVIGCGLLMIIYSVLSPKKKRGR